MQQTPALAHDYRDETTHNPLKCLASAVIYLALEDAASKSKERQQDARRFLHGQDEEHRATHARWLHLAGLPSDSLDKFKGYDADALRAHLAKTARRVEKAS